MQRHQPQSIIRLATDPDQPDHTAIPTKYTTHHVLLPTTTARTATSARDIAQLPRVSAPLLRVCGTSRQCKTASTKMRDDDLLQTDGRHGLTDRQKGIKHTRPGYSIRFRISDASLSAGQRPGEPACVSPQVTHLFACSTQDSSEQEFKEGQDRKESCSC